MGNLSLITRTGSSQPLVQPVRSGTDIDGESRSLGISTLEFKIVSKENSELFILENRFHTRGGPARHLHYAQDEWFYVLEGDFEFEIGSEKFTLYPGDSILAPRKVPHVWAYKGGPCGRILVEFSPVGKMEAFFREVTKADAMPPQDPALWQAFGMELLGPPLYG
jgi:mannose-6-phosphate isomerase-like protein (cupin superfamily)